MSHLSCLTILLIDDCAEERMKLCHLLQQYSLYTYRILEFETATQARKWCQQEIPDIILLDFLLPDGDGLKFIQQFQEYHSHTQTTMILLTGQEGEITDVRAMKSAAQDYLLKDKLTAEVLQGAIHHAVERMYLTRQLEQSREQQQLIAAIALRIRQSVKLEEILRTTATEVRQFLKADRVVVYQFQPDMSGTIVAESVLPGWTVALLKQILDTCFQQTAGSDYRQGKKRVIDDIYQAGLTSCHLHLLEQFEVKANLVVPILVKEQLWGLLIAHQCSGSRHWQSVELDLLDQLAVQIAIAIQQESAYQQAQTELAERQRTEAALKASEEKLKLTLNFADIGYWEWNPVNQLFVSENGIRCFYSDPSDPNLTYEQWLNQIHPEDREWVEEEFRQAIATQTDYAVEYRIVWQDGSIHWLSAKGRGVYDVTGQLLRMLGVLMEITKRKLSEEERRQAQMLQVELQLLENILETAQAGYWDWNIQDNQKLIEAQLSKNTVHLATAQRIAHLGSWEFDFHTQELIWSEEVFQIFGRDPASGTPTYQEFCQSIHPNDRHIHDVLMQQTIKQGKFYEEEYRSYRPDGNLIYLLSKGKVIFDANGQPIQLVGILVDITARKQAEAALRDSERRYATLAQAAPVAIFRLDAFGNCIYINDRWSEMTGRPTEAALGMGWLQAFDPEDRDRLGREWSLKFEQGYPREFYQSEGTHLRPDGCINWFYIQISPESNPFGNIIGYIGTLTDITARKQAESALKESERRYATLAEAAPVGIFRLDNAGNCVYVNDRWSEMTGRSTEAPLGMGWAETLHPEDRDRILREWHEAELGQTGLFWNEGRHLRPDGSINWFYCCIKPETNATGTLSGYIGTLTDISIRKQVEEQLNALSERLTIAISSGGFGIWEYDFVQTKMIWDDRMYELHGLSNTDFSGSFDAWLNCLHPDDRAYMLATIEQVVQAKQEYDVEFRIVEPSGKIRFLKGYGILKRDSQGEPVRMIGVNYDISDRKQAEQELIHNRDLREAIFNESADAIFLVDPQRLLTLDCNRRAVELFEAIDKAELININGQTLQLRPFPASETDAIVTDMRLKGVWSREIEYVTLHGKIFWGNIAAKPITVAGRTMHLVRITDISERKQAEAQLRQTNEQLANANVELARATRLKDEFLANMSHELRTPLNAILGMSEGLEESVFGSINERQAKAIATIERSGRHLLELINDILDLSKIESGKLELQLSNVSVRNLCDISLAFVKQMALKKNIRLSTHIYDNIDSIQVDDRRLRQVLINLLSNAVKFTPERGSVSLEVRREPAGEVNSPLSPLSSSSPDICFQITDTGIGIAPGEIGKLFQPFIQLDSSLNRQYSGTGLGLALVQKIITLHGGTVLVSSEVGKGSCFTVRIPYHTSDNLLRTQVTTSLPSYPLLAENAQVLIIEDSVTAADQITRYFREMGMQSIIYSQGEGAVEEVLRVQPALIILDLQLPNLSGWEVLNQLKTNPKTKDIPAIIISVVDEHSKGLAQGAFEYLVKPITRAQLQVTIEKLQHPARSNSPNLIVVPEVFVDTPLILLAEDNQANIDTISAYLESRGYDLILANNGQQAIDLVRVQRPDLIVMDIQMPGMDGLEAIRRIRNEQQFMHIPMIALTALAMPGDRETSLTAGANEYLTKPVKLKQLVTTIQQLLGR
ncbi:PAS domain-containing protein [Nostoc sp.]|uniref:PAS domain-containing protein n=1 Tax=Nostoc sp. TaxID=1180 RepID=UPI002FFB2698